MFVFSIKLSKALKRILAGALILVLGISLSWGVYTIIGNKGGNQQAQETAAAKVSLAAKTQEDRVNYLKNFKIEVHEDPHQVVEVLVPEEFEGPYQAYNDLQKEQGFDLTKFKGKTCKQWSYLITSPKDKDGKTVANLLVIDNNIVGADVTNLSTGAQHTLENYCKKQGS